MEATLDLGSSAARCEGSSPSLPTKNMKAQTTNPTLLTSLVDNIALDCASVFVLKQPDGHYEDHKYYYRGFGTIDTLLCFETKELALNGRKVDSSVEEVNFDEALDLAKKAEQQAALIVQRILPIKGRVVFVK